MQVHIPSPTPLPSSKKRKNEKKNVRLGFLVNLTPHPAKKTRFGFFVKTNHLPLTYSPRPPSRPPSPRPVFVLICIICQLDSVFRNLKKIILGGWGLWRVVGDKHNVQMFSVRLKIYVNPRKLYINPGI